ncbi:MAG: DUF4097 family beta strand repeat-containing protein [Hespellia sp.]|nr:DUF4097 family beta strand repeat-containing protein [Hespellia sp.]
MKTGWKIFWIVCAVIALIGVGMGVAGIALGFTIEKADQAFENDSNYIKRKIITRESIDEDTADTADTADAVEIEELQSYQYVKDLSVELDAGQLEIKTYDGDGIRCDFSGLGSRSKYSIDQDGEELDIQVSMKKYRIFEDGDAGSLIIYVPKNQKLDEFSLEAGAGEVIIGDVDADSISIECGAGSVSYTTSRSEEDFNYEIECGIGEVRIGDMEFSGLGADRSIDNQSAKELDIQCGVGEIVVRFI